MADEVISAPAVQSTPAGYQVPAAQEIIVRSVRAVVNGTGAAGAFLPTLRLRAPSGVIVWQAPTSATVAAGASADVSWFPRVAAQQQSSGAVTGVTGDYFVTSTNVGAGAGVFMGLTFITGTQVVDLTDPTTPKITTAGVYDVSASMTTLTNATTNNEFLMDLRFTIPTSANTHMEQTAYSPGLTTPAWAAVAWQVRFAANDTFRLLIVNRDSAARNFASDNIIITRVT